MSSSAICSRICSGSVDQPLAAMSARPKGWRILIPDSARVARPSSTMRRVKATCDPSSESIAELCATGQSVKCTDATAEESVGRTSSCQTCSVINGTRGASSFVRVTRHSCKVPRAAVSPSQKRRRDRRTYQLDKSSIKRASARPAICESKSSSAASTS